MSWTRLKFAPGINRDGTRYSADGTWYDANLVRFRNGLPEMWGGWQKLFPELQFEGICRSLHRFSDLSGFQWLGAGTSRRFYMISDDLYYDVTPIETEVTLGTDPLAVTSGSPVITITHVDHGHLPGDAIIISGATDTGGILAATINTEHLIDTYIDPDTYTITVGSNASSTTTGGGAAVVVKYLFHAGSDSQIYGGGYGTGGYGEEEYGGDPTLGSASKLGIWSQDNWGEDLVACANKGPIFYWDATSPSNRMVNIKSLPGADSNAPEYAEFILVSHKDRHLLAFGATEFGSSNVNPMAVRWSDQENILNWDEASTTGTAGSLPLSRGSRMIAAMPTQQEILVWTDLAMYSLRYIGAPYIYGTDLITDFSDIMGLKAATVFDSSVFWVGRSGVYAYTGRIEKIECPIWDYISRRIDMTQNNKIVASSNRSHDELVWFYPSIDGDGEIDSYFTFDLKQRIWSFGSLDRSAWLDLDTLNNPVAASPDGYLYQHEYGADDGSVDPAVPLAAFIESAPLELSAEGGYDKGDRFMFIRRILPDITFRDYSDGINTPKVNFVLKMMDKPGGGFHQTSSSQGMRSAILPVEEFTDELHVRIRGRSLTLRIDGNTLGTQWRLGVPRIDVRTDGQR